MADPSSGAPASRPPTNRPLSVHIEEDHHDVLRHVFRSIGAKRLPVEANVMLHLDSHPDLLLPRFLHRSDLADPDKLLEKLSIENWMLPAAALGLVSKIAWICPPWANQIAPGHYRFHLGFEGTCLRVSLAENYFVGEGIYCPLGLMEQRGRREVELLVVPLADEGAIDQIAAFVGRTQPVILDVDLDFYSTRNPFVDLLSQINLYPRLKEIYTFDSVPKHLSGEERVIFAVNSGRKRAALLNDLEDIFLHLTAFKTLDNFGLKSDETEKLVEQIEQIRKDAEKSCDPKDVDWQLVHDAGCTWDETGLPHHVSTEEEIKGLMERTRELVERVCSPTEAASDSPRALGLVTVARSTLDDFCPKEQVEQIQKQVLDIIRSQPGCEDAKVYRDYED